MKTPAVAFFLSIFVAAYLTPVVRRWAFRWDLVDRGGGRRIHTTPVPRLGGIAIIVAFYIPLLSLAFVESGLGRIFYQEKNSAIGLMVAGLVVGALGVYDDIKGANPLTKLGVQVSVAVALYLVGFRVDKVSVPFAGVIHLGWIGPVLTVVWIVGVINAMNLIDGLDGLAGGVALFAVGTTFILAFLHGNALLMLFMACLAGALVGFLFYNFNPASIFMGDTGSMFLGLVLAVTSLQTSQKSSTAVAILVPIVVLALPIADTMLAMLRRAYRGVSVFSADRDHIHHRLLALGLSQRKAVLILWSICVVLASCALFLTVASNTQATMLLVFLSAGFVVGARLLGFFRLGKVSSATEKRQRNRSLRARIRVAARELAFSQSLEEIWSTIAPIREVFGASRMALRFLRASASEDNLVAGEFSTSRQQDETTMSISTVEALVQLDDGDSVELLLEWVSGNGDADRDARIFAEFLCDHVAVAWDRIKSWASQQETSSRSDTESID